MGLIFEFSTDKGATWQLARVIRSKQMAALLKDGTMTGPS